MTAVLQFPQRQPDYLSTTELARHIRGVLKGRFPTCAFSVRSKSYSGGSSITISWTDGPTRPIVEGLVQPLEGSSFDGMIDLKSSRHVDLNGKRIVTDFIFCQRAHSVGLLKRVVEAVGTHYHAPRANWPAVVPGAPGYGAYLEAVADSTSPLEGTRGEMHWTWRQLVQRACEDRTTLAP